MITNIGVAPEKWKSFQLAMLTTWVRSVIRGNKIKSKSCNDFRHIARIHIMFFKSIIQVVKKIKDEIKIDNKT